MRGLDPELGFEGGGCCSDASGYLVDQSSVDVMKGASR